MEKNLDLKIKAHGTAKGFVIDSATNTVVSETEWTDNLILNTAYNNIDILGYSSAAFHVPLYAGSNVGVYRLSIGGDNTPNSVHSSTIGGGVSATQLGTTITFSGSVSNIFGSTLINQVITYDDGSSTFITGNSSSTEATARKSLSISSQPFTIWNTKRTTLTDYIATTTQGYDNPDAGLPRLTEFDYSDILTTGQVSGSMSFRYPDVSVSTTIGEIGFGSHLGSSMYSRLVFNTPVVVETGQFFACKYIITYECPQLITSPTYSAACPISGWSGTATIGFDYIATQGPTSFQYHSKIGFFGQLMTKDNQLYHSIGALSESSRSILLYEEDDIGTSFTTKAYATSSSDFAYPTSTFGPIQIYSTQTMSDSLVTDSFEYISSYTFPPESFTTTELRTILIVTHTYIGDNPLDGAECSSFRVTLDQNQTKAADHALTVNFRTIFDRDL